MRLAPAGPGGLGDSDGARLRVAPDLTVFAESRAAAVSTHDHPVWKIVLCLDGRAEVRVGGRWRAAGHGVVVPPQLRHTCATSGPYVAVFLDAWRVSGQEGPEVRRLDHRTTERVLDALTADPTGPAELRWAVEPVLGAAPRIDPRLDHVLARLPHAAGIERLAADTGISASHLRALVHRTIGIPLVRLRQWARLRSAVAALGRATPADAAHDAGLTDQAHLTRLSRALLGRTPGSIRTALSATPSEPLSGA